jgi:hypothetical protein
MASTEDEFGVQGAIRQSRHAASFSPARGERTEAAGGDALKADEVLSTAAVARSSQARPGASGNAKTRSAPTPGANRRNAQNRAETALEHRGGRSSAKIVAELHHFVGGLDRLGVHLDRSGGKAEAGW